MPILDVEQTIDQALAGSYVNGKWERNKWKTHCRCVSALISHYQEWRQDLGLSRLIQWRRNTMSSSWHQDVRAWKGWLWRQNNHSCDEHRQLNAAFWLIYVHLTMAHSKGRGQGTWSCTSRLLISRIWKQIGQTLLWAKENRKLHKAFPLTYLYLKLTHCKCQCQGHAHFDCEFLANGDR